MVSFTKSEIKANPDIYQLFRFGGVILFKNKNLLRERTNTLVENSYQVISIDCESLKTTEPILMAIVDGLGIRRFKQMGFDGFDDFLYDIDFKSNKGVVLTLLNFNYFFSRYKKDGQTLLDLLANHHMNHLLHGNRLLTLIQSNSPKINNKIKPIGGFVPRWNDAEWLIKDRGL